VRKRDHRDSMYGTTGTLYFEDIPAELTGTPLQVLALVFFFSGLAFKLSLVPFHLWTADTYQGAPTTVSAYLSVISKGAAAFALMIILMKVFGPMTEQWSEILCIIIVATITRTTGACHHQQGKEYQNDDTFHRVCTLVATTSIVITAVYILRVVGKILYGKVLNPEHLKLTDATWDERVAVICLIACVAGLGLAPFWISDLISNSVEPIISQLLN
jgi:NADH:ubiquinone oxidoreductase subunit 2 (subunit N)